jgi:hypothetical protein
MRIDLPVNQRDNPMVHVGPRYAPELVAAGLAFSGAGYQHSQLSLREFEGARARTAEINGCQVCRSWRSQRDLPGYFSALGGDVQASVASRGPAPDEAFYLGVSAWRTASQYSERERLAIAYAEGLGLDPQGLAHDEAFWARLKVVFSDTELVDLSFCVAGWIGLGRITHALGMDGVCAIGSMATKA